MKKKTDKNYKEHLELHITTKYVFLLGETQLASCLGKFAWFTREMLGLFFGAEAVLADYP